MSPRSPKVKRLPTAATEYQLLERIGLGTCAHVYRAWCPSISDEVAVKVIDLEWFNRPLEEIRREIHVMSASSHPNVVPLSAAFIQDENLWMVMPLLIGGSVRSLLDSLYENGMPEAFAVYILWSTLKALKYFHDGRQIHRDVKAANLLFDSEGSVLLSDYGMMSWMDEKEDPESKERVSFFGTPCWMAPEVMKQNTGYDCKADIWSLGITAIEIAEGLAPNVHEPPLKVFVLTLNGKPPTLPDRKAPFSPQYKDFVAKCLQRDPSVRPCAAQMLDHPLFKGGVEKPSGLVEAFKKASPEPQSQNLPSKVRWQTFIAGASRKENQTSKGLQWDFCDEGEAKTPASTSEDEASNQKNQTPVKPKAALDYGTLPAERVGRLFGRPPVVQRSRLARRVKSDEIV